MILSEHAREKAGITGYIQGISNPEGKRCKNSGVTPVIILEGLTYGVLAIYAFEHFNLLKYTPPSLFFPGIPAVTALIRYNQNINYFLRKNDKTVLGGIKGDELYQQGRFEEAISQLEKWVEGNPDNPIAYRNLGSAQLNSLRVEEARGSFEKALELNPKWQLHLALGILNHQLGDFKKSIYNLDQYFILKPDNEIEGFSDDHMKYLRSMSVQRQKTDLRNELKLIINMNKAED